MKLLPPSMSLALLALISFQSTAEASLWSFAGEKAEGETSTNDFVSPIINREISVSVTAPWPSSPANIYCEAFAFLEKWDFLDALVGSSPVPVDTFASATQHAITLASQLSPATDVSLLQFALAMRSKSPTCELHRGLAEQYSLSDPSGQQAFAVFNGKTLITSLEELQKQLASTETSQLTQAEQKALLLPGEVPRSSYGGNNVIVLYANLGSTVFVEWFSVLTKLDVPFVVRFKGTSDQEAESTTPLQGYGVRLDIRNVEYKVFDDRQDTKEEDEVMVNASSVSQKVDNQYLAGVNVSAILDNDEMTNFTLQADLWKLHDAQTLHSQIIPPAWQRRQLSLQAATAIAHSENNELLVLEQVSQNLPSLASTLVHVEIPDQISDAAEKLQDTLSNLIRSSGNLWVNGKPFSLTGSSFNAFELIDLLQKESRVVENLQENFSPTLSQEGIRKVQMAWSQGSSFFLDDGESTDQDTDPEATEKYIRIQLQKGERYSVIYVNNIERDAQYADWPNSMQQMLMMTQYGMPPSVRRNLVTFVSVENPLIEEDVSFGKLLFGQLSQSHFPARLGVVIVDDREVDECSKWLALTSAPEEVPCPVTKSWLDQPDPPKTKKQMEEIRVTARDIHRCYVYMAKTYSDRSDIISQYNSMFGGTLRGNKDGGFINLFVLLNVHAGILEGIGVVNRKEPILIVARDLMNIVEEKEPVTDYSYGMALRYAATKGLKAGMSFMNGRPLPMASDDTGRDLVSKMFVEEQQAIFGMIYNGEINDSSPRSIYRFLIQNSKEKSYPRVHPLLTAGNSDENMIDLTVPRSLDGSNSYIKPSSSKKVGKVDVIFGVDAILDLNTKQGLEIAKTFISIMESISSKKIRGNSVSAGYRILPSTTPPAGFCLILKHGGELGSTVITEILDLTMQKKDWMTELSQGSKTLVAGLPSSDDDKCADWKENEALPSSNFLVVNGQVYNIENSIEKIDLELLMTMITAETKAVTQVLKPHVVDSANLYGVIARTTAFLAVAAKKSGNSRSNPLEMVMKLEKQAGVSNNPLRFTWNDDCEEGALKTSIVAIVDPVTETAQRLSSLLRVIRDDLKLHTTLVLAPRTLLVEGSKIPISSYYRFVTNPSAYQRQSNAPVARFANLPTDHLLTVRMDVPEPWDIQQRQSTQDTDNLRCDLKSGCSDEATLGKSPNEAMYKERHITNVEYTLNHLLFFGHCYQTNLQPPNGLQLTLSRQEQELTRANSHQAEVEADGSVKMDAAVDDGFQGNDEKIYSDTLVMKNVGYWQLRANPGVWDMQIDDNSRGSEIFDIVDGKISKSGSIQLSAPRLKYHTERLVMGDFVARSSTLLVKRRPGFEDASLFYDDKEKDTEEDDVINVFSLATGHLYERFLKIMMLSVTKRTSSKVKFWLFENFLSPSFKASAIAMSKKIGCEVEFVTYKWPEWLRGQSEKQRIIWGYKILFLDVLFPLGVKKIIYVDADQVVRGDLKELWDMDLHGAPYGYTPMCSSRESTLGFQFWKAGFWQQHLRGKPYHISALYVVDLERFRRDLVGDHLRSIYQQLSADPNSLSNLDQDLPNYAQHTVPIFSLPQEWLWCESWCSDETKADAKTIDLCNNPLHKEPKVSMAKRVISGELFEESWVELDAEVENHDREYFESVK